MKKFHAVVLAAGASERLGQPKPMIPVKLGNREVPLVKWIVERLELSGIIPIVVTNQELLIDVTFAIQGRTVVLNPAPEKGRTGTIQCGLASIVSNIKSKRGMQVLIAPVDRPGFSNSTLDILRHTEHCACPAKDGRGAHPVIITEKEVEKILQSTPETPLREIIAPMKINVTDKFLHLNVDTTDDLEQLQQAADEL